MSATLKETVDEYYNSGVVNLKIKALVGFVQLTIMLGLCLFIPSWSFNFWQAWVYLIIFASSTATITAYLWKKDRTLLGRRIKGGSDAEREKNQKGIQLFASLFFLALLLVSSLDHRFGWSTVSVYSDIGGDILVALGFLLIFFVFRENSFAAAIIEISPDQKVISTGPYGIVRNPMYVGGLAVFFGTPIALGSVWGLAICIPLTGIIVLRLLHEEKFLSKNLPGYTEYSQNVRYRLIPFVW